MKQYKVSVTEKNLCTIMVEANSKEEAEIIAEERYAKGELTFEYLYHEIEFLPVIGVKLNDKCLKKAISVEQTEDSVVLRYKKCKHLSKAIDYIDENNWTYNIKGKMIILYPIL